MEAFWEAYFQPMNQNFLEKYLIIFPMPAFRRMLTFNSHITYTEKIICSFKKQPLGTLSQVALGAQKQTIYQNDIPIDNRLTVWQFDLIFDLDSMHENTHKINNLGYFIEQIWFRKILNVQYPKRGKILPYAILATLVQNDLRYYLFQHKSIGLPVTLYYI